MHTKIRTVSLIAILLLASAACQQPAAPTEEPIPPTATDLPQPAVISAENAASLQPMLSKPVSGGYFNAQWSADGSAFWVTSAEGAALYDSTSGDLIAEFIRENTAVYDVSPDGKTLAYSTDGEEIHLFDIAAQADARSITPDFPFTSAVFNADGSIIGVSSMLDIKIEQWNTASGTPAGSLSGFSTAAPVYSVRYGADGRTLLWFARGTIQPMDISSGKMGPVLAHEDFVSALALSSDGNVIASTAAAMVGGESSPVLTLWDAASGEILRQIANPAYFNSVAISPDSGLAAAGSQDSLLLFSVPHGDAAASFASEGPVNCTAFSPDGRRLIACGDDGNITIYGIE